MAVLEMCVNFDFQMIRVVRNNRVVHSDQKGHHHSIYSLDFQCGGTRLATAGGDGTVRIWDLNALLSPTSEATLAVLCNHTKSVNVVRWSRDGTYLASGSDDCYIIIYKLEAVRSVAGNHQMSSSFHNKENWSRVLTLHGHQMDVLDIDWSPSGLLASASIDNKICIWDLPSAWNSTHKVLTPVRQLHKHTSFVKGVQFDPFGIFLASASADNTIIIWNCESWNIEHILTEPFRESADRSIFRRLSWAPDGSSLCISCATKRGKNVGMVLKRDTWVSVADLVGHTVQTTCCRFIPQPLRITPCDDSLCVACTVAVGDLHGVISIWTTTQNSPLFVLNNVFDGPILDLAWCARTEVSYLLAASSMDGTIVVLEASGKNATGGERLLLPEEREFHLKSIYGRGDRELSNVAPSLTFDPATIRYTRSALEKQTLEDTLSRPYPKSNFQQTVTRLKNGKKRIQPISPDADPSDDTIQHMSSRLENSLDRTVLTTLQHSSPTTICKLTFNHNPASAFFSGKCSASSHVKNSQSFEPKNLESISLLQNHFAKAQMYLIASELSPPREVDPIVSAVVLAKALDSTHHNIQSLWETYVTGNVLCTCGFDTSLGDSTSGIALIGTSLGTLILLCLSSGIRLHAPLILGGSVLYVDIVSLEELQSLRFVALNSEGSIWLFQYSMNSSPTLTMMYQLELFRKTSLNPLRPLVGAHLNQELLVVGCELTQSGEFVVSLNGIRGGCLHFKYHHELESWIQVAHLPAFLSSNSGHEAFVKDAHYSLAEIISHSNPISYSRTDDYFGKLQISQIEDNLISSLCEGSIDTIRYWICKWTLHCCQCGFESRIKHLVSLLLQETSRFPCMSGGNISMLFLNLPKIEILREDILPVIASSGRYQSLIVEISDALEHLTPSSRNI